MDPREQDFLGWLEGRGPAMETDLAEIVAIPTFTAHKAGVDALAGWMERRLAALGFRCAELVTGRLGRTLVARRVGDPSHRLLLIGHLDTVHAPESPFRSYRQAVAGEDRATGPGAADMKGGLVVLLHALMALDRSGALQGRQLTVVLNADEEIGSASSAELIRAEASEADLGLGFEPGREAPGGRTTFVTSRKGFGRMVFEAEGRASHAGVEPHLGASAVLELAHKVVAFHALADPGQGTTLNVGVFRGGETANTVPACARLELDFRFPDEDARLGLHDAILRAAARHHVHGPDGRPAVATRLLEEVGRPALERSEAMGRMAARIVAWGRELGLDLEEEGRGGSSDAALVAEVGCPAICGLGVVGGGFHTETEWIRPSSLQDRARLAALTVHRFFAL
jgi:glutamate carboxypeptidase